MKPIKKPIWPKLKKTINPAMFDAKFNGFARIVAWIISSFLSITPVITKKDPAPGPNMPS